MQGMRMRVGLAVLLALAGCDGTRGSHEWSLGALQERAGAAEADGSAEADQDGGAGGSGGYGQCGDGTVQPAAGETCDDGATLDGDSCSPTCQEQKVLEIEGRRNHTCARLSGGKVKCWGQNYYGQLGLGDVQNRGGAPTDMGDRLAPVDIGSTIAAGAIAVGTVHTCVLLHGGSIKCWGSNFCGELGLGHKEIRGDGPHEMGDALAPVNFGFGRTATAIAAGIEHTCALLDDGTIRCWGANGDSGMLGLGDMNDRGDAPNEMGTNLAPVDLGTDQTAIAITLGELHACALLQGGAVKCWGNNLSGQLGLGDTENRGDEPNEMGDALPPVDLGTNRTALAVTTGTVHSCALLDNGSVKCWGNNRNGQLGLGHTNNRGDEPNEMGDALAAVNLGSDKTATAIAATGSHTCALLNDGSVKCWGSNDTGQLGQGDAHDRGDGPREMGNALLPVDLGAGKRATSISAAGGYTCALLNDGCAKCWGRNHLGQLGLGDRENRGDTPGEMGDALPAVKLFSPLW